MSETEFPITRQEFQTVVRAIRFAVACVVFVLSYLNLRLALTVPAVRAVLSDMLNGKPLPMATVWILKYPAVVLGLAVMIPLVAVACLFARQAVRPFYILGGLILFSFLQLWFVTWALALPLSDIIRNMSAAPV